MEKAEAEKDLLGSIIFFLDSSSDAEHVGIITSIGKNEGKGKGEGKDNIYITHLARGSHNKVIESQLNYGNYSIFTPNNHDFKKEILVNARKASEETIAYDLNRLEILTKLEDHPAFSEPKKGTEEYYQYTKQQHDDNIWRRVKFFARKDSGLTNNRGMRCAQFATIIIQNSEIEQKKAIQNQDAQWVSDKHIIDKQIDKQKTEFNLTDFLMFSPDEYSNHNKEHFDSYQKRIREKTIQGEYEKTSYKRSGELKKNAPTDYNNKNWTNSLNTWSHEEHPCEFYKNTSLPLDSKIASPKIMQHHMRNTSEIWGVEKYLDISEEVIFLKQEKYNWKKFCSLRDQDQEAVSKQRRDSPKSKSPTMFTPTQEEDRMSPAIKYFTSMRLV
jgi:hypothetical protein